MKIKFLLAALLAFAMQAKADGKQAVVENIARNVILKTYTDLAAVTLTLKQKVDVLAAQPTQVNLEIAQQAWRDARVPWESSEAFLFGPVDSLGIDPSLDTWPVNTLDIDGVLSSGRALTVDFVRNLGASFQGFHTIEYLLFGEGLTPQPKQIQQLTARQIQYLQATSILLHENAARLSHAWLVNADPDDASVPGYVEIISRPSFENPIYPSEQAVLVEILQGMLGIVDEVGNGKMSDPLGADLGSADGSLVESPFAWNSLSDFTNNIRSVLNLYTGTYGAHQGPGLRDVVAKVDPALAALVEQRINQAMQKIMDVGGPTRYDYRQAIVDPAGRIRAQAAINDLASLHALIETRVLPILEN